MILLNTGIRVSELIKLKFSQIYNRELGIMKVLGKGGKWNDIRLGPAIY